jgi:hypothetical protein
MQINLKSKDNEQMRIGKFDVDGIEDLKVSMAGPRGNNGSEMIMMYKPQA